MGDARSPAVPGGFDLLTLTDLFLEGEASLIPVRERMGVYAPWTLRPDLVERVARDLAMDTATGRDLFRVIQDLLDVSSQWVQQRAELFDVRTVNELFHSLDGVIPGQRGADSLVGALQGTRALILHLKEVMSAQLPLGAAGEVSEALDELSNLNNTFEVVYALTAILYRDLADRGVLSEADPVPPRPRVAVVSDTEALQTRAAFEVPLQQLADAAQDWLVDDEAAFVTSTLRSIHEWAQRGDANPQMFELLIADLVRKLFDRYTDTNRLRNTFEQLGAEPFLAAHVANSIVKRVSEIRDLGGDDPVADGEQLERIADTADELDRLGRHLAQGAATEAGRYATRGVVGLVRNNWDQIQIGLLLAWRTVKDWFT